MIDAPRDALKTIRTRLETYAIAIPEPVDPIIEESIDEDVARRRFDRPTVNLDTIEGGGAVNSVPRFARAELDVRFPP